MEIRGGTQQLEKASSKKSSQNHRMVGVGRDLCGSSSPTLLPKQGQKVTVGNYRPDNL